MYPDFKNKLLYFKKCLSNPALYYETLVFAMLVSNLFNLVRVENDVKSKFFYKLDIYLGTERGLIVQAKKMLYGMALQVKKNCILHLSLFTTSLHAIKKKSRGFKIGHY